jgi:DNA polymerase III delta prime subunit
MYNTICSVYTSTETLNCLQVCDQPHPLHVKNMIKNVLDGKYDEACSSMKQLYDLGYSPTDIITTLFRVVKNYDMAEYLKLEMLKVTSQLCIVVGALYCSNLHIGGLCVCVCACLRFLYQTCVFLHVCVRAFLISNMFFLYVQETGFAHMRICDGVGSFLQLSGLLAKYALVRETAKAP